MLIVMLRVISPIDFAFEIKKNVPTLKIHIQYFKPTHVYLLKLFGIHKWHTTA